MSEVLRQRIERIEEQLNNLQTHIIDEYINKIHLCGKENGRLYCRIKLLEEEIRQLKEGKR
jgi:hypothetical protein